MTRREVCDDRRNKLAAVVAVGDIHRVFCVLRDGPEPLRGKVSEVVESFQPCLGTLKRDVDVRP